MKSIFPSIIWIRRLTPLWLGLAIMIFIRPTHLASEPTNQISSDTLYLNAFRFANNQNYIHAAIYLFAYVQQNPAEYANNINGHKTSVDDYMSYLFDVTGDKVDFLREVEAHLDKCKKYPCNQSDTDITYAVVPIAPLSAPPDAVIVCTRPQYRGVCSMLFVGNYRTHQSLDVPNDSIASVMVGSRVKITLYTDSLGHPPMISLTHSDPDLSNDLTNDGYRWNRVISTAKVELR